jgi:PEP-CTERM motif
MNARIMISAGALALAAVLIVSAPAEAALTLIVAAGGGGGAGVVGGNGGAGQTVASAGGGGGDGGGAGGASGFGGFGGTNLVDLNGGGGAGWLGGGSAGLGGGGGGFSSPSFAGGAGDGGGGFGGGGGGAGAGGGGGGGYSGGGGGAADGFGGGGGSYVSPAVRDVDETFDDNGTDTNFTGLNGVVTVGSKIFYSTGSVVEYTIPTSYWYFVLAIGAQGGGSVLSPGFGIGGYGAGVGGEVYLTQGTELDIVVGEGGAFSAVDGGGGGGSFVWDPTAIPVQPTGVLVQPAPEPSTWAMMLIGFAGLGYAGYRRARGERPAPALRL